MRIITIFISYIIGYLPFILDEKNFVYYILCLCLYIGLFTMVTKGENKKSLIIPMVLSHSSSALLILIFSKGAGYALLLGVIVLYLLYFLSKSEYNSEKEEKITFIKHLALSISAPITFFLTLRLTIESEWVSISTFTLFYFFFLVFINIKPKASNYFLYIVIQACLILYLSGFSNMMKGLVQLLFVFNIIVFYIAKYKRTKF